MQICLIFSQILTGFIDHSRRIQLNLPDCSTQPNTSVEIHESATFSTPDSYVLLQSEPCLLSMFCKPSSLHPPFLTKKRPVDFKSQWCIPNLTLSLSNCSLRSAMTALWDWRVWSDATCLLSRSRWASSRDATSFSSRRTSSSRCCRSNSDCNKHPTFVS